MVKIYVKQAQCNWSCMMPFSHTFFAFCAKRLLFKAHQRWWPFAPQAMHDLFHLPENTQQIAACQLKQQ